VAGGEGDDDAGAAADGSGVGVEGGQEQVVGLFDAADGGLSDSEAAGELGLGEFGGLPEGGNVKLISRRWPG
jgi:hypothetical protein